VNESKSNRGVDKQRVQQQVQIQIAVHCGQINGVNGDVKQFLTFSGCLPFRCRSNAELPHPSKITIPVPEDALIPNAVWYSL